MQSAFLTCHSSAQWVSKCQLHPDPVYTWFILTLSASIKVSSGLTVQEFHLHLARLCIGLKRLCIGFLLIKNAFSKNLYLELVILDRSQTCSKLRNKEQLVSNIQFISSFLSSTNNFYYSTQGVDSSDRFDSLRLFIQKIPDSFVFGRALAKFERQLWLPPPYQNSLVSPH